MKHGGIGVFGVQMSGVDVAGDGGERMNVIQRDRVRSSRALWPTRSSS
jgi:hypothetical protein